MIKQIYDRTLATPLLTDDITHIVQHLRFSTKLPGGFSICSFDMRMDWQKAFEFITSRHGYRLVITDDALDPKHILFEGRIEDPTISPGTVGATAYGYWASLSDVPYWTAYNATLDVITKAVLTANCPSISSDQSHIATTDVAIISTDATLDIYPNQIIENGLAGAVTTGIIWDAAVWENKWNATGNYLPLFYLTARAPTTIDWDVRLQDFNAFDYALPLGNLWNDAYAIYTASSVLTRTATNPNAASIAKYGVTRRYVIPNLGEVAAAYAQAQRDKWITEHKDVHPRFGSCVLGEYAYNTNGIRYPSSWVRAGQVLRISDLVPATGDLSAVTLDGLRTFFIIETEYDEEARTNRLTLDTESTSLDSLLARKL